MRALIALLLLAGTVHSQDVSIVTRPGIIYVEPIAGIMTPMERAVFHIVIHNVSQRPITIDSVRFEMMNENGTNLSGQYGGMALMDLFDSAMDRRRIEPTAKQSLNIDPDQRKAIADISFDWPAGFAGHTLNVEVQYQIDGRIEIGRSRSSLTPAAGFTGRVPFDGTWYVAGEHGYLDTHRKVAAEVFAYDFLQIGANGRSYQRDGARNSDYHAYGKKVLASKDGVVAAVVNNIAENNPGATNVTSPGGNVVIIDHGGSQFGYYAHLKPGSISLKVGAQVRAGDVLGEVGNSGDSKEPHLHFHVMTSSNLEDADALPLTFESWKGQAHTRAPIARQPGVLPRGEFVEP